MRLRRQKTEKSALSAVEAMVRRRSIDSLGAPWRGLPCVFGACGLLLMPQAGICLKLCQLDLPRLDVANEVRNFNLCAKNDSWRAKVGQNFRCACISPFRDPILITFGNQA